MTDYQNAVGLEASSERQDARRMPASSRINGYPISPAALLNPRAYQKQMANGIPSLSFASSNLSFSRSGSEPPCLYHSSPTARDPYFPDSQKDAHQSIYVQGQGRSKKAASLNGDIALSTPHFDPKQLLNPKGFNRNHSTPEAEKLSTAQSSTNGDLSYGPSNASAHGTATAERGHDALLVQPEGMGSLIERMHNVSKREDQPRKKQKKEHHTQDEEEDRKKATFAGGGKGGDIGEYMKQRRQEGLRASGPTSTLVDLTAGMNNLPNT